MDKEKGKLSTDKARKLVDKEIVEAHRRMNKELEELSIEEANRQLQELGKLYPVAARERIYRLACHVSQQLTREWLQS